MITSISWETALHLLRRGKRDILAVKIAGLLEAYGTDYPFCKVFAQHNVLMCRYYQDGIITRWGELSDAELNEISAFLQNCGFARVLADPALSMALHKRLNCTLEKDYVMRYIGTGDDDRIDSSGLEQNPSLDEIYPILQEAFPEINYRDWYTDWNHRIRHRVGDIYLLDKTAAAAVMREQNECQYVSFVAVKGDSRGRGKSGRLLNILGQRALDKQTELMLICRKDLMPFYKRTGFEQLSGVGTLTLQSE